MTAGAATGFVFGVPLSTSLGAAVGGGPRSPSLPGVRAHHGARGRAPSGGPGRGGARDDDRGQGTRRARLAVVSTANVLVFLGQFSVYTYVSVLFLAAGLSVSGVGPRSSGWALSGWWGRGSPGRRSTAALARASSWS
ncbi:hypothetical protein NKG05_13015 [Oerskovia sp. M15]